MLFPKASLVFLVVQSTLRFPSRKYLPSCQGRGNFFRPVYLTPWLNQFPLGFSNDGGGQKTRAMVLPDGGKVLR